jgi:DNA polymerase (family 10)
MLLHQALTLAEIIVQALAEFCERIEIAGSIRRGRPTVGDIDLVILPKPGRERDLRARVLRRARPMVEGNATLIAALPLPPGKYQHSGDHIQLDLWFAQPEQRDLLSTRPTNWGTLLLARTGSREHNIRLAGRAQQLGLHWNPHQGVFRGDTLLASATEHDVFKALDLPFIPPAFREADCDWEQFRELAKAPPPPQPPAPTPVSIEKARAILAAARERLNALSPPKA